MGRARTILPFCLLIVFLSPVASQCPAWRPDSIKTSELLLYFPTMDDPGFPSLTLVTGSGSSTTTTTYTGAKPFDIAQLVLSDGTTEPDLIAAIVEEVRDDYCEFDVRVTSTRMPFAAATPPARRQTVAVGTDDGGGLHGLALWSADPLDADPRDHARVWAGTIRNTCQSIPGFVGITAPADSIRDNWVRHISGVISHEAGHNYGLWHNHSSASPGEDTRNHLMATTTCSASSCTTQPEKAKCDPTCIVFDLDSDGTPESGGNCCGDNLNSYPTADCCVNCADRIQRNRRFSDTSYGILATTIGLCTSTLSNWDFVNPNSMPAEAMEIEVLSQDASLYPVWSYNGSLSPWTAPVAPLAATSTRMFRGTAYNVFVVRWDVDKPWSNGPNGVVPPGATFHTGISFTSPSPIIVGAVTLFDESDSALLLAPRILGYDSGAIGSTAPGLFDLTFFNAAEEASELCISDITVRFLPRMADIETMTTQMEDEPITRDGFLIEPLETLEFPEAQCLPDGTEIATITLRALTDPRFLDLPAAGGDGGGGGDVVEGADRILPPDLGRIVGLFPSTYVYVTATVTDPNAEHWDPIANQMVVGPLETRLFYQFSGIRPDCNENGIDDLLDIDSGTSFDTNVNGMPDECESAPFIRGDVDVSGSVDVTDPVAILNFLFSGAAPPECLDAADASDEGSVNIVSAIHILNFLFQGGPPPAAPFPACGADPTEDALGCALGCP